MGESGRVVYFVRDLVFTAKIREAGERLGVELVPVRDPHAYPAAARGARLVIVDLRLPQALEVLAALAGDPDTARVASVGFVGHEERSLMEAARAAGCTQVMAKGEFATRLPALLGVS
jgi:AmiR/NasT family two-component response regulator